MTEDIGALKILMAPLDDPSVTARRHFHAEVSISDLELAFPNAIPDCSCDWF
jgi:hypothetical protein